MFSQTTFHSSAQQIANATILMLLPIKMDHRCCPLILNSELTADNLKTITNDTK